MLNAKNNVIYKNLPVVNEVPVFENVSSGTRNWYLFFLLEIRSRMIEGYLYMSDLGC